MYPELLPTPSIMPETCDEKFVVAPKAEVHSAELALTMASFDAEER